MIFKKMILDRLNIILPLLKKGKIPGLLDCMLINITVRFA
jgi:hypothetical protein